MPAQKNLSRNNEKSKERKRTFLHFSRKSLKIPLLVVWLFLFSMAGQVINQVLLDALPVEGCFSTTTIENYILPSKQYLERGRALVACGFVRGIQLANRSSKYRLTGYVQAEKATGKWYKTKLSVEKSKDKWTTVCTCKARNHSTRCKHQAVL